MFKRMTVVFDDDELYTALKVESARSGRHAKDIVAKALVEWFESKVGETADPDLENSDAQRENEGGPKPKSLFDRLRAEARR